MNQVDGFPACQAVTAREHATDELRRARETLTPALQRVTEPFHQAIRSIIDHHFGWPQGEGGKFLRGALALITGRAFGSERDALPAAIAVELLHNFSLLHDDVMDGDRFRRNRASAWVRFGVGPAILAGDALFAAAYRELATAPTGRALAAQRRFTSTALALLTGQAFDLALQDPATVSVPQYEEIAAGKTAALISCAAAMGAELAGAPAAIVESLAIGGHHLGLAFQAVDDALDLWGDPAATGKGNGRDLRDGKVTLPMVLAREHAGTRRAELDTHLRAAREDHDAVGPAAGLIERFGGRELTARYARWHADAAVAAFANAGMADQVRQCLTDLVEFAVDRDG